MHEVLAAWRQRQPRLHCQRRLTPGVPAGGATGSDCEHSDSEQPVRCITAALLRSGPLGSGRHSCCSHCTGNLLASEICRARTKFQVGNLSVKLKLRSLGHNFKCKVTRTLNFNRREYAVTPGGPPHWQEVAAPRAGPPAQAPPAALEASKS